VVVQRDDGALAQPETRHGHGLAMDHLAGNRGVQLIYLNLSPCI